MENINNLNRENGQKLWAADWNKLVSTINLIINVVNNQSNLPEITKLSQLINDSGFVTQEYVEGITGPTATINKVGKVATITITDKNGTTTAEIKDGEGSGDMLKETYDANNNGIVDNAEKVNNHTVESDVPTNAKFTDTQADWNENDSSSNAFINNKPIIPQLPDLYNGHEYVDLGLPSGTLWATMNVGAASETDYGNYYQYGKGDAQYAATSGDSDYSGTEDPLDLSRDTARVVWGGSWHMPTRAQMEELTANTTYQWVTNYKGSGINGGTFTATNGAVLFFPAAGYWNNGSQDDVGDYGNYWGSSPNGSDYACYLYFYYGSKDVIDSDRESGCSVRPVITPSNTLHKVSVTGDYNDLSNKPTIPSPTAVKGNAESEFRTGNVNITPANIGLGNVGNFKAVSTVANQGLTDTEKTNARTNIGAGTSSFSGSYNDLVNKPIIPEVSGGDDAARANWSGDWRMPTTEEFQALGAAVNTEWSADYQSSGIAGLVCTDKTDSSKILFFPAAGYCNNGSVYSVGSDGRYWSSSVYGSYLQVAYYLNFSSGSVTWQYNNNRNYGCLVRPILDDANANGHDYVEIGGIKWATMNIGASSISDYGLYFQWGDVQGYTADQVGSGEGQKYFGWADYKYSNGTSSPGAAGMTKYNSTDGLTTLELSTPVEYLHKIAVTGDYNDLSNKPTIHTVPTNVSAFTNDVGYLTQHQDISGKQDVIDAQHELSADLVDDTNTTNKFTSTAEKTTWNGKYSKPATGIPTSDLEDDLQGHVYVDLGLPSGTLWATRNVGAIDELDAGDYYMQGIGAKKYDAQDTPYQGNVETIPFKLDSARQVWGDEWRMPTAAEFNELLQYAYCHFTDDFNDTHIRGLVCEKYGDSNTYIFLPAGGIYGFGRNHLIGSACYLSANKDQGYPVILEAEYGDSEIKNGLDIIGYNVRPVRSKLATGSGNSDVPTLNAAPTSSTVTYAKDGQVLPFEIGQFCRVPKTGGGYDFYQMYDLQTVSNVTTATWEKIENIHADHEDVYIAVTVDSGAPSETTAAGLVINVYYNDASEPTTTVTTDSNGMASVSVPNGYKYRLVFPTQQGCRGIADVVHTASVSQRSVEVEYQEATVEGETVKVILSQKNGTTISKVSGATVNITYDGTTTAYTTDSQGMITSTIPYGKQYTITVPQRQDWYLRGNTYTLSYTAGQSQRVVTCVYHSLTIGMYVVASDGSEYLLSEWEAAVEGGTRQNSEAILIKIATSALVSAGGVFCLDIDMVRGRTQGSNRAWASQNVQFNSIPLNGNSTSAAYYYDGLSASRLIQQEGDERSIDTLAADQCLAMSRTIAAGTESELTLPGFLGSVGQWNELWKNVAEIDDILLSTRPNGTYLMSTWTTSKWTCTQANARSAYYWGAAAVDSTKTNSYDVLPFFAY